MSVQNPQLEDGFTPIANTIMEALAHIQLSGYEWRILFFLLRKTYGWSKKSDIISLGQFVDGTGICKKHVINTISLLVEKNIIKKSGTEMRTSKSGEYEFNKHCGGWKLVPKSVLVPNLVRKSVPNLVRKSVHTISIKNTKTKEKNMIRTELVRKSVPDDDVPPDLPELRKPSAPYQLALWFYESRGIPAKPTGADMRNFKMLLDFYTEDVIKKGITWRLEHDPEGFWSTHISSASVYRNFGNWMSESTAKALKFDTWLDKNPSLDYRKLTDLMARADGFMRAFNEARKNQLVYFEDADYMAYRKCIRIKTREAHDEVKGGVK